MANSFTWTPEARKKAFEDVFLSHKWGNSANAGKGKKGSYKRPYNKTKHEAGKGE